MSFPRKTVRFELKIKSNFRCTQSHDQRNYDWRVLAAPLLNAYNKSVFPSTNIEIIKNIQSAGEKSPCTFFISLSRYIVLAIPFLSGVIADAFQRSRGPLAFSYLLGSGGSGGSGASGASGASDDNAPQQARGRNNCLFSLEALVSSSSYSRRRPRRLCASNFVRVICP